MNTMRLLGGEEIKPIRKWKRQTVDGDSRHADKNTHRSSLNERIANAKIEKKKYRKEKFPKRNGKVKNNEQFFS